MKLFRIFSAKPPRRPADSFDVFDQQRLPSKPWNAADAGKSIEAASRVALGLLRTKPTLRRKFPSAISMGESGPYCQWLCQTRAKLGLSTKGAENIRAAFASNPGKRVMDLYLRSPDLQRHFPSALLTAGQTQFVEWLGGTGGKDKGITEAEILWFLHQTAEQIPVMAWRTWLINPAWQKAFPLAERDKLVPWLRETFRGAPGFSKLKSLPPLPRDQGKAPGVNLLSHFCYPSGIQQAALNIKRALESVEWNVSCRDVPISSAIDTLDRTSFLGPEVFPVTFINVAPDPFFRDAYARSGLLRRVEVRRIAWWNWELDAIPRGWAELAPLVDEVWAPSAFVGNAFRKGMPLPIHEILPGVALGEITPVAKLSLGIPEANYVFLFMFDMASQMERKNPLAVIRAFRAAFSGGRGVSLVIKVSRGASNATALAMLHAEAREAGAIMVDAVLPHAQAQGILQMCDCFVSLHRSEGFGLCLAEAMLMGKPAIATNYSGNLNFMHGGNSLLVDYTLTEIIEDIPNYPKGNHWAEPSLEHAVSRMRYCYENPAGAAAVGAVAQVETREKLSLRAAGQRIVAQLAQSQ